MWTIHNQYSLFDSWHGGFALLRNKTGTFPSRYCCAYIPPVIFVGLVDDDAMCFPLDDFFFSDFFPLLLGGGFILIFTFLPVFFSGCKTVFRAAFSTGLDMD